MLFHNRTILPGGFRVAEQLTDLTSTGSGDSVAVKDFAWVKDQQKFYVCAAVTDASTSSWTVVEFGGGSGGTTALRIASSVSGLEALGTTNGVAVDDLAWVQDSEKFYVCTAAQATTSTWAIATGLGDVKSDTDVTFTGHVSFDQNVTLGGTPSAPNDAIPKSYVDNQNFIKADGSVAFTGVENYGGNRITGVGTPTADSDAATKLYVDTKTAGVIGALYKYAENTTAASTNNTDLSVAGALFLTLVTTAIPQGTYRLAISYHWKDDNRIKIRVTRRVTGSAPSSAVTVIGDYTERQELGIGAELHVSYTFIQQALNAADYTYEFRFASANSLETITVVNGRIELQRVG